MTSAELGPGALLDDRYAIQRVLGRGGFGITYAALDQRLQRQVAIKELFPPSAARHGSLVLVEPHSRDEFVEARARFQREAASLARFAHPGIVRVYEVFEAHNTAYLVMELLDGRSLHQVLVDRGGPFGVEEVLDVVLRVGGALTAVHDAGLLHRDINPTNVMVDVTGRIVLIDFGLARQFGADATATLTRAVTPGYAPPEQYAGSGPFGPTCDVYGLAATTYKLLTGVTPANVFDRQGGGVLIAPQELNPDIPTHVGQAIVDGMELNAAHRPATAALFLDRLGLHGRTPPARALISGSSESTKAAPSVAAPSAAGRPDSYPVARPGPAGVPGAASPVPQGAWPPVVAAGTGGISAGVPAPGQSAAGLAPPGVDPRVFVARDPIGGVQSGAVSGPRPAEAFAPWHDGSPPVIGPVAPGRGWITYPLGAAAVALMSSMPIVSGVLLVVVVLPAVATSGDLVVHRHRQASGATRRSWHRAEPNVVAPALMARNVIVSVVRSIPAIAIVAVGVLVAGSLGSDPGMARWHDLAVRVAGLGAGLSLVIPARRGGRSFRSEMGLDLLTAWAMEGRNRPGTRIATVVFISVFLVALGLWLQPDLWPLGP